MTQEKKIYCSTELKVGSIVWTIVKMFIFNIFMSVIGAVLVWTVIVPIIAGILGIVNTISVIFEVIGMCVSKAQITDDGISGRSSTFGSFDFSFDRIKSVKSKGSMILIKGTTIAGKKKKCKITGKKHAGEFKHVYNTLAERFAAEATAATEAEATAEEAVAEEAVAEEAVAEEAVAEEAVAEEAVAEKAE